MTLLLLPLPLMFLLLHLLLRPLLILLPLLLLLMLLKPPLRRRRMYQLKTSPFVKEKEKEEKITLKEMSIFSVGWNLTVILQGREHSSYPQ